MQSRQQAPRAYCPNIIYILCSLPRSSIRHTDSDGNNDGSFSKYDIIIYLFCDVEIQKQNNFCVEN